MTDGRAHSEPATRLIRATDRLADRCCRWTAAGWRQPAGPGQDRADVLYAVVQQLADLDAARHHEAARPVPRLATDLALPDQLKVVARDLLIEPTDQDVLVRAAAAVEEARERLGG